MEREPNLISEIIDNSFSEKDKPPAKDLKFEFDLQFTLRGDGTQEENGRPDIIATSDGQRILIENKIVKESITVKQVTKYHELADLELNNKSSWVLIITPDHQKTIEENIFNKLAPSYKKKTLFISWLKVYDLCKNQDKNIVNELMEALKMQGIKPFDGFSKNIEHLSELQKIGDFFDLLKHKLEEKEIETSSKSNDTKFTIADFQENLLCPYFSDGQIRKELQNDIFYAVNFNFDNNELGIEIRWQKKPSKSGNVISNLISVQVPDPLKQ